MVNTFDCTGAPSSIKTRGQKKELTNGAVRVSQALKVAAGAFHSLAITTPCSHPIQSYTDPCPAYDPSAGDLYVWGNNRCLPPFDQR